jgi:hypothetical protein
VYGRAFETLLRRDPYPNISIADSYRNETAAEEGIDGVLLQPEGSKSVFYIHRGIRHPIGSWDSFLAHGFDVVDVIGYVPHSLLSVFPLGEPV